LRFSLVFLDRPSKAAFITRPRGQCALRHGVVNTMYLECKTKCVRLPVNGTMPTATHSGVPLGTLEVHPVCSIPKSTHSTQQRTPTRGTDSVSRPLLAWSTRPIARFLRVFYTLDCPTNQYPFSSGRGGREQITCWCCSSLRVHNSKNNENEATPLCVIVNQSRR
jgi:hypothetical protein